MSKRPNVLFIMTDHTNAQATAPGSQCLTPNLDRLAADGVRFGRCYTTNAISSPARASLMTSLYPSTHGMWDCTHTQRPEWVDVPADRFTYFSRIFAEAGYRTGYFGKWHVEQSNRLEDFGWHEYDARSGNARAKAVEDTRLVVPREGYRDYFMAGVSADADTASHPAFEKGIDFIRRHASEAARSGDGRPFMCFVSTAEPHDPYVPPKRFFDMYDVPSVRVSPTLRDEPDGKPEVVRRMREVWLGLTDDDWRFASACYWAVITFIDHEVARIIECLRELELYEDTIVIFTSDHGDMLGAHGLATKGVGTSYEEVYNIPLVVRVPGMERGREDSRTLVSLVDLAPTLLDLCGLDPIEAAQGRSMRTVLEGPAPEHEWQDAYAEFFGQRFVYTQRITWHRVASGSSCRTAHSNGALLQPETPFGLPQAGPLEAGYLTEATRRGGDWKYVFSPGGVDELYDLADDPNERTNLAGDPAHRQVLIDMTKRMWRKMKEIGDQSLFGTHYATLRTAPIGPNSVE